MTEINQQLNFLKYSIKDQKLPIMLIETGLLTISYKAIQKMTQVVKNYQKQLLSLK